MRGPVPSSELRSDRQRGQSALEFLLALLIAISLGGLLFQALHFELDVFNRSALARHTLFEKAKQNQPGTDSELVSEEITGKRIGDLPVRVLEQAGTDIGDLRYGPRNFRMLRGTKAWDPLGAGLTGTLDGMLVADHSQYLAGYVGEVLGYLSDAAGALDF